MTATLTLRTRYVGPTDMHGSRIRVETLGKDGKPHATRSLPYNYAASNAHEGAVLEYLHALGYDNTRIHFARETRSGQGNVYTAEAW